MEITFVFLLVAMLGWMVWCERKYARRIWQRLDKVLDKLEEKVKDV